jgi:hypothetical protein
VFDRQDEHPNARRRAAAATQPKSRSKNWSDKVRQERALKRVLLEADFAGIKAGNMLFVGTPEILEDYVRAVPRGEVRTIERMRREIARRHRCDAMCPVSTAIFLRMVAEAAWEQIEAGKDLDDVVPFWRVIEPGSTLAKKLRVDSRWIAMQREVEAD